MNSLKKGEGFPLLSFEVDPGVPLLNFRGFRVPLLNFEGRGVPGPGTCVPRSPVLGSCSHFYNMPLLNIF